MNGLATLMVVIQAQVWVSTLVVGADIANNIVAIQGYEDFLSRTNQACVTLDMVKTWWMTLDEGDQIKRALSFKCVQSTEVIISAHAMGAMASKADDDDDDDDDDKDK
jgi:hypothetical protein